MLVKSSLRALAIIILYSGIWNMHILHEQKSSQYCSLNEEMQIFTTRNFSYCTTSSQLKSIEAYCTYSNVPLFSSYPITGLRFVSLITSRLTLRHSVIFTNLWHAGTQLYTSEASSLPQGNMHVPQAFLNYLSAVSKPECALGS